MNVYAIRFSGKPEIRGFIAGGLAVIVAPDEEWARLVLETQDEPSENNSFFQWTDELQITDCDLIEGLKSSHQTPRIVAFDYFAL